MAVKTYTKEIDNSKNKIFSIWDSIHNNHDRRTESFSRSFYQAGPQKTLKNKVLFIIGSAKKMLVISSFLFADEDIKEALIITALRGVNIYFLTAATGRLEREPDSDSEFDKRVYKEHIEMLKAITPYIYTRSADHFHAKVVIADPFQLVPKGILLTANLTTEALERNEELGYVLSSEQAGEVGEVLRYIFWEEAEHHAVNNTLSSIKPINSLSPPRLVTGVYYNSKKMNTLKERVVELIKSAEREIIFSTFGIDENHETFKLLLEKLHKGVKVKLFARFKRGKLNSVFQKLKEAGAEVYGFEWLHAKAFLIDRKRGFLLTANLEPHGMDNGFELGVNLSSEETAALSRLFEEWEEMHQAAYFSKAKFGELSREFYRYDPDTKQYRKERIRNIINLPVEKIDVKTADELREKTKDFDALLGKAKTMPALKVILQIEKNFKPKKKNKTKG